MSARHFFITSTGVTLARLPNGYWLGSDSDYPCDVDGWPCDETGRLSGRLEPAWPVIDLYELTEGSNLGALIVRAPTGVLYTNQVGGTACSHPQAEGFLVPLRLPEETVTCVLDRWPGSVLEEHLDELDRQFVQAQLPLRTARRRLRQEPTLDPEQNVENYQDARCFAEAWIWVDILADRNLAWSHLAGCEAVLTYGNSD